MCPKCHGKMKIFSFIKDYEIIKKILKHLGLWDSKQRLPPKANALPSTVHIDYSARSGPTHLPVATQAMHSSKHAFLGIQFW